MKVTKATTKVLHTPVDSPLAVGVAENNAKRAFVTLELETDEGIDGIGLTFIPALNASPLLPSLNSAVDALAQMVVGQDPMPVEAIATNLMEAASGSGPGGIFSLALSAVDMALWDIKGKALNQSVCSLLGGYRDRLPTYASGALMRTQNLESLSETAPHLLEMGFKQMKTQLGGEPTVGRELERIKVLRDGIGDDIDLMCDINQLWSVNQAIDIGKRLEDEDYHLFWLEDVVEHDDYQGFARVADALTIPIAAGEYHYGVRPFRHMLEARSIDIVMIDLLRVGGITQWRKVAAMAEAFNLPVVSHLVPEIHVQLMASIPNGLTVEYMPWTLGLFEETPELDNGDIVVPDKPGLGLKFDQAVLKQYQVS